MNFPFHFRSMKIRVAFWLAVMGVIPVLALGAVWFHSYAARYRAQALERVADGHFHRLASLDRWVRTLTSSLSALADDPLLIQPPNPAMAARLLSLHARTLPAVEDLFLVDVASGLVFVSSNPKRLGRDLSGDPCVVEPLKARRAVIGVWHRDDLGDSLHLDASVPVQGSAEKTPSAVLVATVRPGFISPIDVPGTRKTPAAGVVSYVRMGERFYDLVEGLPARLPVWADDGAIVSGSLAKRRDVAGAAYYVMESPVAGTGWALFTLADAAGIDGPLEAFRSRMLAVTAVSVLFLLGAGFVLARRIARPVAAMVRVTGRLRAGDLSARCEAGRPDELGVLALSFNQVVDSLSSRMRRQAHMAALQETMVAAVDLEQFAGSVLERLLGVTGAHAGACYVRDPETGRFLPRSWLGMDGKRLGTFDAESGEGEIGRAVTSRAVVHVTGLSPETRFVYKAVAGDMVPRELLTVPVSGNGRVHLVFSLARTAPFAEETRALLDDMRHAFDTACSRLLAVQEIRHLTDILSARNEELRNQKEELEVQAEELQAQSEELMEQAEELRLQAEELREQNVELELQQRQLNEANRLKDEFLSNMSHELRTPLNSILALSRVLDNRLGSELSEEHRGFLHIIERNGRILLDLINDILDLSKVESGNMDVYPEVVSLPSLVNTAVENIRPLADKKGLALRTALSEDLPALETDGKRLYQILQNLVSNAVKFTESGHVEIGAHRDDAQVVVTVRDTGIGIAAEDLPHIFDKFRQVDGGASRRYEGTGLGLAIARRLAELLGGELSAESRPGEGSVFTLRLPVAWQGEGRVMAPASFLRINGGERPVILVVEDEEEVRREICSWLEEAGYSVRGCGSAQEAMEECTRRVPAAILLDVVLPGMDGYEALRRLKKTPEWKGVPVLLMSAARDDGTARLLGADGFVGKPVNRDRLLSQVRRILESRKRDFDPAGKRLLVVEDNEAAILQIRSILESAGYRPDVARTGAEALDYVDRIRPDGILLDLMMPDVDGLTVLEKIRQRSDLRQVPVLVLTAKELTARDRERLASNHIFQLVHKGDVNRSELLEKIRAMLSAASQTAEPPVAEDTCREMPAPREGRPRILVVEDNPDNRVLLHAILDEDYEVRDAENGREGLELIGRWHPDLVLLDVSLPEMDGLEVARRAKADPATRHIPLIAVTAHAMAGDRNRSKEAGCDDHLSKPFRVEDLLAVVRRWIDRADREPR